MHMRAWHCDTAAQKRPETPDHVLQHNTLDKTLDRTLE